MMRLFKSAMPRTSCSNKSGPSLRCVRPSLLDLRFTGDPWVVDHEDGTASVRLDNYRLAHIEAMPFELPSLNQLLLRLRLWQIRRSLYRPSRALGQQFVPEGASSP
jgi:hypothetical protein